jgi:hypothetical protein
MSIQDVWNVPNTPDELTQWSVLHMILHRDQIRAVYVKYNTLLAEYVLDPIDVRPNSMWFQQHQLMHNAVDALTKVAQFDLVDVDWSDPTQFVGWIQAHAQLHQQEATALDAFS